MSFLLPNLYSALYLPAAPAVALYLASRADSRARWRDYLGRNRFDGQPPREGALWVHAVSAGEVLSAAPVARELANRMPELGPAVLTTTIQDALDVALRRTPEIYASRTFLPLDLALFQSRLIAAIRPRLLLLSETDFWPNLLVLMKRKRLPVYLVNGRISEKAGEGYRRMRGLLSPGLDACRLLFVQREIDAVRLAAAGAPEERIHVRPNTKYERPGGAPPAETPASRWLTGGGRPVLVAGSTHDGEEKLLLEATRKRTNLLTVLVPRNPGRARQVASLSPRSMLWSGRQGEAVPAQVDCVVVDTMGELDAIYPAASVTVIGGSFGQQHGHNFLEPAWHGKPIVCGPDMANFESDVQLFREAGALEQVMKAAELESKLGGLLDDPARAATMGERARKQVEAGQGTAARLAGEIAEDLEKHEKSRNPLRVLFAVSSEGIGGGERQALVTMEAMREQGLVAPELACKTGGWLETEARGRGIAIFGAPFLFWGDLWTTGRLAWRLSRGDIELLHTHLNVASYVGGWAAWATGVPCVATLHGLTHGWPYRRADSAIAVSKAVHAYYTRYEPALAARTTTIYSGLPPLTRPDPEAILAYRTALGIAPEELVFTAIGKFHPNKNQKVILEAAQRLPKGIPWRVLLIGDGPEARSLKREARKLGPRVIFAGERDETPIALAASDVLIVPSKREAFGLVALEAAMLGTPVMASEVDGLREIVQENRTGRTFFPWDATTLARLLDQFIRDPAPFRTLADAARLTVLERFPLDRTVRETAQLYHRALRGW